MGFRISRFGFRVSGFRVWGLGFKIQLGFRVEGFGELGWIRSKVPSGVL